MRSVEHLLRDNGADYFKITTEEDVSADSKNVQLYAQFDLIWKYHGLTQDFIVYIDMD